MENTVNEVVSPTIDNLPPELVDAILGQVTPVDRVACAHVSSAWRVVALDRAARNRAENRPKVDFLSVAVRCGYWRLVEWARGQGCLDSRRCGGSTRRRPRRLFLTTGFARLSHRAQRVRRGCGHQRRLTKPALHHRNRSAQPRRRARGALRSRRRRSHRRYQDALRARFYVRRVGVLDQNTRRVAKGRRAPERHLYMCPARWTRGRERRPRPHARVAQGLRLPL